MANAFYIPFNNEPVNTGRGNESDTYTVPSGKYARVIASVSVKAYPLASADVGATGVYSGAAVADSGNIVLYLDEGEELSFDTQAASANGSSAASSFVQASSFARVVVDSSNMFEVQVTAYNYLRNSAGTNVQAQVGGAISGFFRYEEYNKIS